MKRPTLLSTLKLTACLAASLISSGCAKTLQIKVVDAASGVPLAGVVTIWKENSDDLLTGRHSQTGPVTLPPTSLDGFIWIDGVHDGWANSLILSKPGYKTLYGNYSSSRMWMTERMRQHGETIILEEPYTEAARSDSGFTVRMSR